MNSILAVDPGVRGCGVAYFERAAFYPTPRLQWARYLRNPVDRGDDMPAILALADAFGLQSPDLLVVEFPKVYAGGKAVGDPHDLLTLAALDGAIAARVQAGEVRRYFPREWKGQLDKDTCHARIRERLSPEELQAVRLPIASLAHNVWDAVGIGLKAAGRFERKMVIAR